jgi:hypothetical protein
LTRRRAIPRGRRTTRELLDAMSNPQIPPLGVLRPELPKTLRDVVTRGLERDPERRDVVADEMVSVLRIVNEARRGRLSLVESIAAFRLTTLHRDSLVTTPTLPEVALSEPSIDIALPDAPPPFVVNRSERPVVFTDTVAPPSLRPRPPRWLAVPVSLAVAGCAAILFVHTSSRSSRPAASAPALAAELLPSSSGNSGTSSSNASSASSPRPIARPQPTASSPPADPASREAAPSPSPVVALAPPVPLPPAPEHATFATVTVPASRAGHRVWIDGRLVGQSPGTFHVSCGTHAVRVGSHGALRRVQVACAEDVEVR